jgi:hypothetical protein
VSTTCARLSKRPDTHATIAALPRQQPAYMVVDRTILFPAIWFVVIIATREGGDSERSRVGKRPWWPQRAHARCGDKTRGWPVPMRTSRERDCTARHRYHAPLTLHGNSKTYNTCLPSGVLLVLLSSVLLEHVDASSTATTRFRDSGRETSRKNCGAVLGGARSAAHGTSYDADVLLILV